MKQQPTRPKEEGKKDAVPPTPPIYSQYHAVESAKIGDIYLQSEVIRADQLLGIILTALKNKDVKKYLAVVESKKQRGVGVG